MDKPIKDKQRNTLATSEEQAITSAPYKPKIWKRYVDDTFTILDQNHINSFLQQLNSQQPTIHFTMETGNNNTIPLLDNARSVDGHGQET